MQKRVKFDFEVVFVNGGGLSGKGFQLYIPDEDISDENLTRYVTADIPLSTIGKVKIYNKMVVQESYEPPTEA